MKSKSHIRSFVGILFAALALVSSEGVLAASDIVVLTNDNPQASATLTEEDFASAKPMEMVASPNAARQLSAVKIPTGKKIASDASGPTAKVSADTSSRLFDATLAEALSAADSPVPVDFGSSGARYTISGMIPDNQTNALTYPHVTTGKLYFQVPGGTAYCTASVINRRVLLAAGHCASNGQGGFYSGWRFVPATWNGSAPLQIWNWRQAVVRTEWHNGGGGVPNSSDWAMFELEDRFISGAVRRIGTVTGWLGWRTLSCRVDNHLHMLGYPGNVFGGVRLALSSAETWRNVNPFLNCEYGNPQTFGASGGPWVQNFGTSVSPKPQNNPGRNQVTTVASYTYGEAFGVLGGSEFENTRFISLWNFICNNRVGNCTP